MPVTYPFVKEKSPKRLQIYNIDFPPLLAPPAIFFEPISDGNTGNKEKATNIRKFVFPAKGKKEI